METSGFGPKRWHSCLAHLSLSGHANRDAVSRVVFLFDVSCLIMFSAVAR